MRRLYREYRHWCGNYLDIDVYPIFRTAKYRSKKFRATSETQKRLNERNCALRLLRLLNLNLTGDDIKFILTYKKENRPESKEEAAKDIARFLRRARALFKKLKKPMKYVTIEERGEEGDGLHFHVFMTGGLTLAQLVECWGGLGYIMDVCPMQYNETGVAGLAFYANGNKRGKKIDKLMYRRYNCSRNMIRPEDKEDKRDGKISAKRVEEIATYDIMDRKTWEELYPGWCFASCESQYNEFTSSWHLHAHMYKPEAVFGLRKRKPPKTKTEEKTDGE